MKYALRLALLSVMALAGGVYVCGAAGAAPQPLSQNAQPGAQPPAQTTPAPLRFTVLRGQHVLGPSVEMTAAEAHCAVTGTGDSAGVRCRPVGVTQKNEYNYNVTLISEADGTAYVIACRQGLVSNTWCKGLAEGRILRGTLTKGHFTVMEGDTPRDYLVLGTAQIGPLDTDEPIAAPAAKGRKGRAAQTTPAVATAPVAPAPVQSAAPAATPQARSAPAATAPAAAPPAFPTLGDLPAACVSSAAADATDSACVSFVSEPSGAEIYIDGKFVGSTPSLLPVVAGSHEIRIEASSGAAQRQYKPWTRTFQATAAGKITLRAVLEPAGPTN